MEAVDLIEFRRLLHAADDVVSLREYVELRKRKTRVLGLRHDVDDRGWDSMLAMAQWERRHGFTSTYYLLHTAPYWGGIDFGWTVRQLESLGHEVGIHNNALAVHHEKGSEPHGVLASAIAELRSHGVTVTSTASHGDQLCYVGKFVNYNMFEGHDTQGDWRCPMGVERRPLSYHGLEFSAEFIPKDDYLSDSGGAWSDLNFPVAGRRWPLIVLQHPDWWPKELFHGA